MSSAIGSAIERGQNHKSARSPPYSAMPSRRDPAPPRHPAPAPAPGAAVTGAASRYAAAMQAPIVFEFVPPVDTDPRYRAERKLRHAVLRAPLGHPAGSERMDFEPHALHLVARDGDAVVGCVMFNPDGHGGGRLCQMAVHPDRQGQGLGGKLVRHLEARLRADGIERVVLHARREAAAFYARLGYAVVGEPYEEVGIAHVDMARSLVPALTAAEVEAIIREGVPESTERRFTVEEITARGAVARHPFHPGSLRPGGTVSGPTLFTLADAAMYAAVLGHLGDVRMAVTSEVSMRFLRRPPPRDLVARAEILRVGRRQAVIEVRIYADAGSDPGDAEPVAVALGTYALPEAR